MSSFFPVIFLSKLSPIGVHYFILLFAIMMYPLMVFRIRKDVIFIGLVSFIFTFLSVLNGQQINNAIIYGLKNFVIFGILYMRIIPLRQDRLINYNGLASLVTVTLLLVGFYIGTDNYGVLRFQRMSGIHYDPNFVCYFLISILMLSIVKSAMVISIFSVLTQSISVLVSAILTQIFINANTKFIQKLFMLALISIAFMSIYIALNVDPNFVESSGYISQRINSLLHRLIFLSRALYAISDGGWAAILFGFGSGRSYEISDSVLHSFLAQGIFDNGLLGFTFIVLATFLCCKDDVERKYWKFSALVSFSIDVFGTGLFSFFIFWKRMHESKKNSDIF